MLSDDSTTLIYNYDDMDILEKIKLLRIERHWSEYQLSQESGIPQSTISSWYKKQVMPSLNSLKSICEAFNITLGQFFSDDEYDIDLTENQKNMLKAFNKLPKNAQQDFIKLLSNF